jgi:hypothetical protein
MTHAGAFTVDLVWAFRPDKVRVEELAGILERGRGMGWTLQEPGVPLILVQ